MLHNFLCLYFILFNLNLLYFISLYFSTFFSNAYYFNLVYFISKKLNHFYYILFEPPLFYISFLYAIFLYFN